MVGVFSREGGRGWIGAGSVVLAAVVSLVLIATGGSAWAQDDVPLATTVTVTSTPGEYGTNSSVSAVLTDAAAAPVPQAVITLQRVIAGDVVVRRTATTDAAGRVVFTIPILTPAENAFTLSFAGTATHAPSEQAHVLSLRRAPSKVTLAAPGGVKQGRTAKLGSVVRTRAGVAVAGATVRLQRKAGKRWVTVGTVRTDSSGSAQTRHRPLATTRYRALAMASPVIAPSTSGVRKVRLRPLVAAVRLPRGAPRPRVKLPPQPLAFTAGPQAVVTPIPDSVWRSMQGRSWRAGCLPRTSLRLLRVNYWDYSGFRRRGELVASASAITAMSKAFSALYRAKIPVRSMYRVDRFGWSKRLRGADDYKSMAAGNTSAFNCRNVVGRAGVRSPHATGRALDLNPWENPYASPADGWVPNRWWVGRCHAKVGWCSGSHRVVKLLRSHGLRWTYGVRDRHHFDA